MHADTPLHTLLEREQAARDAALVEKGRADDQLRRARVQADQLALHRAETIARWNAQSRQPASVEMLHTYRSFLQRLDQALAHQELMVARLQAQVERAREALVAAEMRVASVRKLIERRTHEAHATLEQREQRASDDLRVPVVRNPFAGTQL